MEVQDDKKRLLVVVVAALAVSLVPFGVELSHGPTVVRLGCTVCLSVVLLLLQTLTIEAAEAKAEKKVEQKAKQLRRLRQGRGTAA